RAQHRVADLARHDLLHVLPRRHRAGLLPVAGNATANHDAHQISLAGEPLSCVVEAAGEPTAAVLRVDHHLDPVERRPGGLVVADEAAVRDLVPAAPVLVELEVEDQAAGARHQAPLVFDAELTLGEAGDLAGELLPGGSLHSREAALL